MAADKKNNKEKKQVKCEAWVAGVNMGYGHQRTAHALRLLAPGGKVINANDYDGIPARDRKIWQESRRFYEAISKFKRIPLVGHGAFAIYDRLFQQIADFYPMKDLSRPPFLTNRTYGLIKKGWGRHFVARLEENPMPLITTFFITAFMAEEFDYSQEIYLVVCDADISRQWAPKNPLETRINYCAPTRRVVDRLKLYGVPKKRIFLTGYPLPEKNIFSDSGKRDDDIIKLDLAQRLANLDPQNVYLSKYCDLVNNSLCAAAAKTRRPLTIMFSAGGAGAQGEIGLAILRQMKDRIIAGKLKLILSAGANEKVKYLYENGARAAGLDADKVTGLEVLFESKIEKYFDRFNKVLRQTDILWTKPSELSFYSALGVPIIVAPPIGSQEDFNKSWLLKSGFGLEQGNLRCIGQWLDDWLENGYLAEAAMEGFIEGERMGVANIKNLVFDRKD